MEDKIFGKMIFRYGWTKTETIELWGRPYELRIRTSSGQDELPNEKQQVAYTTFKENLHKMEGLKESVIKFILNYHDEIKESLGDNSLNTPIDLIVPKEVLFFQNGKYAIIFDTKWSEAGMAILYSGNNIEIGESYILEYES